jgi:hypothetical protein
MFLALARSMFKSDADRAEDMATREDRRERRRNRAPVLNRLLGIKVNPPRLTAIKDRSIISPDVRSAGAFVCGPVPPPHAPSPFWLLFRARLWVDIVNAEMSSLIQPARCMPADSQA